jgi:hypothetical protein
MPGNLAQSFNLRVERREPRLDPRVFPNQSGLDVSAGAGEMEKGDRSMVVRILDGEGRLGGAGHCTSVALPALPRGAAKG